MLAKSSLLFALVLMVGAAAAMSLTGGLEDEQPADEHIRKIVESIEDLVRNKYSDIASVKPTAYKAQVVAGMNYFVRAVATMRDGKSTHLHLRIYQPISSRPELTAVRVNVGELTPLKYFQ